MTRWLIIFTSYTVIHFSNVWAQVPLKLAEALRQASEHNPKLKSERLNVPVSETELDKAKLYLNPVFNIQYLQLSPSSMYYNQDKSFLNAYNSQDWFQLTKKFQLYGQRQNKVELARLSLQLSQSNLQETKRNVLYEVSLKWIDAWRALAHKKLSIRQAKYLDNYLKENYDSVQKVSFLSEEEKLRFQILDNEYEMELQRAEHDYFTTIEELKLLIGSKSNFEVDLGDTSELFRISNSVDSLFNLAVGNRQDIKSLQTIETLATQNVKYQKSLSVPAPEAGFIWNPQNRVPYAGIYLTQTLPFFDRNQTEVQKAKFMTDISHITYENNMEKLRSEVNVAYLAYLKKKRMLETIRRSLRDSERLLYMVRDSNKEGKNAMVDLWEAEQTWVHSYTLYYDSFAEYRKSYVTLLYQLNLLGETK